MGKNILIIEDEPSIADNIRYALENENFSPFPAATAGEGKQILEKQDIDLIVLDVGLPDINGFEFCKELRKHSDIPIVFLTARSDEIDRIVGLEIGGDDYVTKPFSPRELAARVKAILRRHKNGVMTDCKNDCEKAFKVCEEKCEIRYFSKPLSLARYEYKMLCTFLRHPGRIFSRKQLMERVWEEPEMSMERTVDTHVKTLRAKLKNIKDDIEPIITHRGFGYSLNDSLQS